MTSRYQKGWMEGNYCLFTVEGFRMWFKSNAPYVVQYHNNCVPVMVECKPCWHGRVIGCRTTKVVDFKAPEGMDGRQLFLFDHRCGINKLFYFIVQWGT